LVAAAIETNDSHQARKPGCLVDPRPGHLGDMMATLKDPIDAYYEIEVVIGKEEA